MKHMFKTSMRQVIATGLLVTASTGLLAAGYYAPGYYGYAQAPYAYGQTPAYGSAQSAPYAYAPQSQGYGPYYAPAYSGSPYGYGYPGAGYGPMMPFSRGGGFSNAPWNKWKGPDIFGDKSPFQDPLQHEGNWAKKGFYPWRTGPFAYDKWRNHPATKMPWGNFPGWGKGFFGGYGPDQWKGATPWGNDVPFKWLDPTDPEESIANMWEDALNTPNKMGRMPPGWTAPYISVPNPIDVENEFERNAKNAPDEIHNMWGGQGGGFGADQGKKKDKDGKPAKDKNAKPGAKGQSAQGDSGKRPAGDTWQGVWKDDWWQNDKRQPPAGGR